MAIRCVGSDFVVTNELTESAEGQTCGLSFKVSETPEVRHSLFSSTEGSSGIVFQQQLLSEKLVNDKLLEERGNE